MPHSQFLIDRPKATQANVRIACRLSDATAPASKSIRCMATS